MRNSSLEPSAFGENGRTYIVSDRQDYVNHAFILVLKDFDFIDHPCTLVIKPDFISLKKKLQLSGNTEYACIKSEYYLLTVIPGNDVFCRCENIRDTTAELA